MRLIEQSTVFNLSYPELDDDHAQFVEFINRLNQAGNTEFKALFVDLMVHTQTHFDRENLLMDNTHFPARTEHNAEHQRILNEFKQFHRRVDKGLIQFGRSFVTESLPAWFDLHVKTMDSALVAHIKR
ncbi:hemerythrin domain-containing protein [Methylophaga sp.]|uniref:hemerythrin domain-containing protein n=1 Tax=Methylophaga sp. TaxID=2024840 RepID=UPI002727701D|nr:hemerythrin domain-containing protein [Methylophaga sp.]MDO8828088.1 hemerythrin domain-containing protein [Methylophaga sp.]